MVQMKKQLLLICALLLVALTSACSRNAPAQDDNSTARPTDSQETRTADKQNQELQHQIEQIASAAKGPVGVEALVMETGERVLLNPHDHFSMQSV